MRRLLAFAALALVSCVTTVAPPSPTPTPTPTASPFVVVTATPTPSPTIGPLRLGLVQPTPNVLLGLDLRTEDDARPFASLDGSTYPVVSPDGRRLAYWHRDAGAGDRRDALRAMELVSGQEIELVRLDNELAGGIAWRDDGGAVVFSAISPDVVGPGAALCPVPAYSAARTVEVGSPRAREVRRMDRTRFFPLAWSSTAKVIAGQDACEALKTLIRVREDGTSAGDTQRDQRFGEIVDVSRDAKQILAQFAYSDSGKLLSGIRVVGADAPRPVAERVMPEASNLIRARFRPGTSDVVALLSAGDSGRYALEVWPAGSSTSRRVWTSATAATTTGDVVMRIDGKAAYVLTFTASGGSWQTIDLETGAAAPFAIGAGGFQAGPLFFTTSFFITDAAIAKLRR